MAQEHAHAKLSYEELADALKEAQRANTQLRHTAEAECRRAALLEEALQRAYQFAVGATSRRRTSEI